jgi:hypothetical protein
LPAADAFIRRFSCLMTFKVLIPSYQGAAAEHFIMSKLLRRGLIAAL